MLEQFEWDVILKWSKENMKGRVSMKKLIELKFMLEEEMRQTDRSDVRNLIKYLTDPNR